jgi:hypothetical protein
MLRTDQWFDAFQSHWQYHEMRRTGEKERRTYEKIEHQHGPAIRIPASDTKIVFIVDYDHSALKFNLREGDEQARDIIYTFLEKLWPRVRSKNGKK